jgi:murein DD-endopeptidase MepM/ murein hydrolase activator NlpD
MVSELASRNVCSVWPRVGCIGGLVVLAFGFAGCSADIGRFDSPLFGLNESSQTGALGAPPDAAKADEQARGTPALPPSVTGRGRETKSLKPLPEPTVAPVPPVSPAQRAASPTSPQASRREAIAPASPPAQSPVPAQVQPKAAPPAVASETIEVQPGDTLYGLSRKHKVSVHELQRLNGLSGASIRPGQRLVISGGASKAPVGPQKPLARTEAPPAPSSMAEVAEVAGGTYTVKPGDSLYAIARNHRTTVPKLQELNGIGDVRKVKPGMVLKLPGGGAAEAPAAAPQAPAVARAEPPPPPAANPPVTAQQVASAPASPSPTAGAVTTRKVTIINPGARQQAAAREPAAAFDPEEPRAGETSRPSEEARTPAPTRVAGAAGTAAAAGQTAKLRWPVRGQLISGFGPRTDGTQNDGIDIAVPMGTLVEAADAGVVAYVGSELKGFGNLVLVRHESGWVTAYAHNAEVLVKRGDRVTRGQAIAKAGKTGAVDQPMVHFELRQGAKPVDPSPHMEKL